MTIEDLRQKPVGVLEERSFFISYKGDEYEEHYFLGKLDNGEYFIGFSDDGCYCSHFVCEKDMVKMINNKALSDEEAYDIYFSDPHLSCWMD